MLTTPTPEPWFATAARRPASPLAIHLLPTAHAWTWTLHRVLPDGGTFQVEAAQEVYRTEHEALDAAKVARRRHEMAGVAK